MNGRAATSGIGWILRGRLSKLGVRLGDNLGGVRVEAIERPLLRLGRLELDAGLRALRPGPAASDLVVTAAVEVPVSDSEPQYAWEVAWADAVRAGDLSSGIPVPLEDGLVWAALHQDAIVVQLPDRSGPLAGQPAAALLRRGVAS